MHPGHVTRIPPGIPVLRSDTAISLPDQQHDTVSIQYLGCGGLYLLKDGVGILIDPFFSNPGLLRLAASTLFGKDGKRKIFADSAMVDWGLKTIEKDSAVLSNQVKAIFSAHSHYDHLMDIPAVFEKLGKKPTVWLNESGFQVCSLVIDTNRMEILEHTMTTREAVRDPVVVPLPHGKSVQVYPILSDHNPHAKHVKFYDGSVTQPVPYFKHPYDKTKANDWLEGNTFSFLIDYRDTAGAIELRLFVQSSSCNPPAGIPPAGLPGGRPIDVAFLGLASYEASPAYPRVLLEQIQPRNIVWIHWEDFFCSYRKKPKTVRGTDVPGFFNTVLEPKYKAISVLPYPGVKMKIGY